MCKGGLHIISFLPQRTQAKAQKVEENVPNWSSGESGGGGRVEWGGWGAAGPTLKLVKNNNKTRGQRKTLPTTYLLRWLPLYSCNRLPAYTLYLFNIACPPPSRTSTWPLKVTQAEMWLRGVTFPIWFPISVHSCLMPLVSYRCLNYEPPWIWPFKVIKGKSNDDVIQGHPRSNVMA